MVLSFLQQSKNSRPDLLNLDPAHRTCPDRRGYSRGRMRAAEIELTCKGGEIEIEYTLKATQSIINDDNKRLFSE